jgi:hypothetical protein
LKKKKIEKPGFHFKVQWLKPGGFQAMGEFQKQSLKPDFHFIGARVGTRRLSGVWVNCMGHKLYSPTAAGLHAVVGPGLLLRHVLLRRAVAVQVVHLKGKSLKPEIHLILEITRNQALSSYGSGQLHSTCTAGTGCERA